MVSGTQIDRRKTKSRAFRLGKPLFMRVPKSLVAPFLTACALIAIFASSTIPAIAFGPFYLVICAFGAWFVGNRFAVLLGLFIVTIQVINGYGLALQDGPIVLAFKFCSALAVVLMLGVARAALEIEWRFARIDALTGALNRKAFFEAVEDETGQAGVTVLVFADLDGLKHLNDRLGHEAGDEALRDFADRVGKAVRKDDVFARIGGDEFVIFLRVRDIAAAESVAQRLNGVLNADALEGATTLKCSLGVLVLPVGSRCIDVELKQADTLMYHAKRERIGLKLAISVKDDMQEPTSIAPNANSGGQQRATIRSAQRATEQEIGDGPSHSSIAA